MPHLPSICRLFLGLALPLAAAITPGHAQTTAGTAPPPRINLASPPAHSAAANPAGTADIHDLHSLVPLTYWERNGVLIISSSVAVVILLALSLWLLLKKKPPVRLTPFQMALRDLEKARPLAEAGQDKAFAIAASDAVRHYLENAYRMPAPERTTEEFLLEAARHAWLRGELEAKLRRFLEFCDLAKFAGQQLGGPEREQLLAAARAFLDTAEKLREPPAPAKAGSPPPVKKPAPSTLSAS